MRPEPFRVRFTPRSDRHREIILREAAIAREFLKRYDGETTVSLEPLEM